MCINVTSYFLVALLNHVTFSSIAARKYEIHAKRLWGFIAEISLVIRCSKNRQETSLLLFRTHKLDFKWIGFKSCEVAFRVFAFRQITDDFLAPPSKHLPLITNIRRPLCPVYAISRERLNNSHDSNAICRFCKRNHCSNAIIEAEPCMLLIMIDAAIYVKILSNSSVSTPNDVD